MGRLIEEQTVIECLTNTAKYYEREDADEWTKGIHYGLLHGLDNILDNVPKVEAIPKDQYEARLKSDMVAMLTEIQLEIGESVVENEEYRNSHVQNGIRLGKHLSEAIIQEKINSMGEINHEH